MNCNTRKIVDNTTATLINIAILIYIIIKTNNITHGLLYILLSNIIIGYAFTCSSSATLYIRAMMYNTKILGGILLLFIISKLFLHN